jgi:hypothetical protein
MPNEWLRKCKSMKNAVLIGASLVEFGSRNGAVSKRKVIIISSVKCNAELLKKNEIEKNVTKAYKLLPTSLLENISLLVKYAFEML